eukprot:Gb_12105 [translate_table: standard]
MDVVEIDHAVPRSLDSSSEKVMDGENSEKDKEGNQSFQHANGHHENGNLADDLGYHVPDNLWEFGKENKGEDVNTNTAITKADGLQELVMLAEEFESEEAIKRKGEVEVTENAKGSTNQTGDLPNEQKQQSDVILERHDLSEPGHKENTTMFTKGNGMEGNEHSQAKSQRADTSVLEKSRSAVSQTQKSKHSSKGVAKAATKTSTDTNLKHKKGVGEAYKVDGAEVISPASNSSVRRSVNPGTVRSNYTVPQPFALATDKRAFTGVQPVDREVPGTTTKRTSAISVTSSVVSKKPQSTAKPAPMPSSVKPLHSESLKLQDQNLKPPIQVDSKHDDDDACSVASSTATSNKASKAGGPSSAASAPSFSFRCNERAEKRKEFFSKLEEKLHAKELEKNQLQAKSKVVNNNTTQFDEMEQQEAEIKQLRKSLTFKATPLPNFYQEAAPPKIELKKIPPTRAKSPKLGRRNSCIGLESEADCARSNRVTRFSLDQNKINGALQELTEDENADKAFGKDSASSKKTVRRSLTKMPSTRKSIKSKLDEIPLSPKQDTLNMPETKPATEPTENGNLTTSRASHNASASDEDSANMQEFEAVKEKADAGPLDGQDEIAEVKASNDQLRESDSPIASDEVAETGPAELVKDVQELDASKSQSNGSTVLFHSTMQKTEEIQCDGVDANESKSKSVVSHQEGPTKESLETHGKGVRNPRRERVKAITPSFTSSKREATKSEAPKRRGKGNMAPVVADVAVQS